MAIAAKSPSKLLKRNRSLLDMSKQALSDFASTPRKGLPKHKKMTSLKSMMESK